ncbi:hypothetical protein GCM10010182_46210 [Actinomadura cremea]|nr:hypothetical protein GCM10010182_46210 [Actinomadura cremea]
MSPPATASGSTTTASTSTPGKPRKEGTGADDDQDAPKPSGKCADTGKNDDPDEDDGGVTAEQVTAHVRRAVDRATLAPVALQAPARAPPPKPPSPAPTSTARAWTGS